ncbi:MAG: hypothetical protein ACOYMA_19410 [Bacteroidia bacterium]
MIDFNSKWLLEIENLNIVMTLTNGICRLVIIENEIEIVNEKFEKNGHYWGTNSEWYVFDKFTQGEILQLKLKDQNNLLIAFNKDRIVLENYNRSYLLKKVIY